FFFSYADGKRKTIFAKGNTDTTGLHYDLIGYRDIIARIRLPLNLSSGPFIRKVNIAAQGMYTDLTELNRLPGQKKLKHNELGDFYSFQYDASFEMQLRQGLRDVAPRFGTFIHYTFRHTPFISFLQGRQSALDASLYLPG